MQRSSSSTGVVARRGSEMFFFSREVGDRRAICTVNVRQVLAVAMEHTPSQHSGILALKSGDELRGTTLVLDAITCDTDAPDSARGPHPDIHAYVVSCTQPPYVLL